MARVGLVVIDEAHCISDWGFDFRPDYQRLARALLSTPTASVLATTATANQRVTADVEAQLGAGTVTFRGTLARTSLRLSVVLGPVAAGALRVGGRRARHAARLGHRLRAHRRRGRPAGRVPADLRPRRGGVHRPDGGRGAGGGGGAAARQPGEGGRRHLGAGHGLRQARPRASACTSARPPRRSRTTSRSVAPAARWPRADAVLLSAQADERIWEYFATASIPNPDDVAATLRRTGQRRRARSSNSTRSPACGVAGWRRC